MRQKTSLSDKYSYCCFLYCFTTFRGLLFDCLMICLFFFSRLFWDNKSSFCCVIESLSRWNNILLYNLLYLSYFVKFLFEVVGTFHRQTWHSLRKLSTNSIQKHLITFFSFFPSFFFFTKLLKTSKKDRSE